MAMHRRRFVTITSVAALAAFIPSSASSRQHAHAEQALSEPPYHTEPPHGPLPETLDPARFRDNPKAFASYSVAAQIRELLYQLPCYCSCSKQQGHESLLDCFVGRHALSCGLCQQEAVYGFLHHNCGESLPQIRRGLAQGEAWRLDVKRYADEHYPAPSSKNPTTLRQSSRRWPRTVRDDLQLADRQNPIERR
jgi:hypothetical protein